MTRFIERKNAWVVLSDGPFAKEQRQTDLDEQGVPPEMLQIVDSDGTFASIISGQPGEEIPLQFELYELAGRTEAGIWRYRHKGSRSGHFTYAG